MTSQFFRRVCNVVSDDIVPIISDDHLVNIDSTVNFAQFTPIEIRGSSSGSSLSPRQTSLMKLLFGIFLTGSGVILNIATPIYTLVISERSDIYVLNIVGSFWTALTFLFCWVMQRLTMRQPLYFTPTAATKKTFLLLSFVNSLTALMITFSSLPSRTPKYLLAILTNGTILFVTIFRKLMLNKGISVRRVICLGGVLLGLFVAAEPTIFDLPMRAPVFTPHKIHNLTHYDDVTSCPNHFYSSNSHFANLASFKLSGNDACSTTPSLYACGATPFSFGNFFWPVILFLSNIPCAMAWVIFERESKRRPHEVFLIAFYAQLLVVFWVAALFWLDVIPGFGQSDSVPQFWLKLKEGLLCHYSPSSLPDSNCHIALGVSVVEVLSYSGLIGFQVLLMSISEGGAVFAVIVSNLSVPLNSIFWLLFDYQSATGFFWSPFLSLTSLFPVLGFSIMFPSILFFSLVGRRESDVSFDS